MRTRCSPRLAAVIALASLLAGCGAGGDAGNPSAQPWQLRLVTSSSTEPCSAPPLTSADPGAACDTAGTTTYQLGASLGGVRPDAVTREGSGQTVVVRFGTADSATLGDLTTAAVGKQLAFLVDGRVISAARVEAPITTGLVAFAVGTADGAEQLVAALVAAAPGATATP